MYFSHILPLCIPSFDLCVLMNLTVVFYTVFSLGVFYNCFSYCIYYEPNSLNLVIVSNNFLHRTFSPYLLRFFFIFVCHCLSLSSLSFCSWELSAFLFVVAISTCHILLFVSRPHLLHFLLKYVTYIRFHILSLPMSICQFDVPWFNFLSQ